MKEYVVSPKLALVREVAELKIAQIFLPDLAPRRLIV